jgi:hypothetical protein
MTKKYQEVCKALGFLPEVQFVKLNRGGSIGFTCGRPQEIRALLKAVNALGLTPSKALVQASR